MEDRARAGTGRTRYDSPMAIRIEGWAAIAFAERNGCLLSVHAAAGEKARDGIPPEEARRIAAERPERVYVDFDPPPPDGATRLA
jgi:hypothetical protein